MITDTHHCPSCGHFKLDYSDGKVFTCSHCDFVFFFNAATAVGGVMLQGDTVLVAVRAHHPSKGLLDFPGGFVDPGESLETALARELKEELCVDVSSMAYLTSAPNDYLYKNVPYTTCDAYFICQVESYEGMTANDDISSFQWVNIHKVEDKEFAFESSRHVVKQLRNSRH